MTGMRSKRPKVTGVVLVVLATLLLGATPPRIDGRAKDVPRLVFVSRRPAGDGRSVPGLGPVGRTLAVGGRLLVRERRGDIHPLLPGGVFFDVSDPCVSWDGRRILFAAIRSPGASWRIWVVDADGSHLQSVTGGAADSLDRNSESTWDDLDPAWLPDGRICFSSTRWPQRAQRDDLPVTNLYVATIGVGEPARITSERNGAEEPSIDPVTGRVVYARWWFNRYLASDTSPHGVTTDPAHALPHDEIDLWTAASIAPDGDGIRLAGGDPRSHAGLMAYQPVVLTDGSLAGVFTQNPAMIPAPGRTGIQVSARGLAPVRRIAGPGSALGGRACAPAALADGRVLFSWSPENADDFGIYIARSQGEGVQRVVNLPGTHELDAEPLEPRRPPPVLPLQFPDAPSEAPARRAADLDFGARRTFRFDCLNVFTQGGVDVPIPDAPPIEQDVRIRFFSVVSRPERAGGDSLVFLLEAPVDPSGAVHVDAMIADVPAFEQLVDVRGCVLQSGSGPAHVPGFNYARAGAGTKCVGCHTGHSLLPVPSNSWKAKWLNAAPSARVTASSWGSANTRGLVDRRTRGDPDAVAWVALGRAHEWVELDWDRTIEVRAVVLYALRPDPSDDTNLRVREAEIAFFLGDREVKHLTVQHELRPEGTRIECDPVRVDAIRVTPTRVTGRVRGRPAVALAEVETVARLLED
jgi:WD40-like Beta Propeller Repeat